jgi:nucleotide-binding universal stress UspA family protein
MRVLFATDGSERARAAGKLLAALPLPADTRITILSVAPESNWIGTPPLGAEVPVYSWLADSASEEEKAARRDAEEAASWLGVGGRTVETIVPRGQAATAILEQAEAGGADLIVVGSHGKGAVTRFLMGSVSERVARHAHCSVLVARGTRAKRVIIGVDGSESAERALDALVHFPLPDGAETMVVYVHRTIELAGPAPPMLGAPSANLMEEYDREGHALAARVLAHARHRLCSAGREASTRVRCGAPAEELMAVAREWDADLLVVGAENRSALGRLFLGSVSGRVLTHAPCSVLVARCPKELPASDPR